jgi:hypothetical protein
MTSMGDFIAKGTRIAQSDKDRRKHLEQSLEQQNDEKEEFESIAVENRDTIEVNAVYYYNPI